MDGVADALVTLIHLLRPVYDNPSAMWPLSEEISFLHNYCALMKMRYGKDVLFNVDIPLGDQRLTLPRFILQPCVENSFEHATKGSNHMTICITRERRDAFTVIRVTDDGSGITPNKCEQLTR